MVHWQSFHFIANNTRGKMLILSLTDGEAFHQHGMLASSGPVMIEDDIQKTSTLGFGFTLWVLQHNQNHDTPYPFCCRRNQSDAALSAGNERRVRNEENSRVVRIYMGRRVLLKCCRVWQPQKVELSRAPSAVSFVCTALRLRLLVLIYRIAVRRNHPSTALFSRTIWW